MALFLDSNKFKMAAAAILDNFEWPYLLNGSWSTYIGVIFAIAQLTCYCNSVERLACTIRIYVCILLFDFSGFSFVAFSFSTLMLLVGSFDL